MEIKQRTPSHIDETTRKLMDWVVGYTVTGGVSKKDTAHFLLAIRKFPTDVKEALLDAVVSKRGNEDFIFTAAFDSPNHVFLKEALAYCEYTRDRAPQQRFKVEEQMRMINGIREYSKYLPAMDDYSKAFPSVHSKIAALLSAAAVIVAAHDPYTENRLPVSRFDGQHKRSALIITSDELIRLIIKRPHDAERIGQIVGDRQSHDTALIVSILDSESPAISAGTL